MNGWLLCGSLYLHTYGPFAQSLLGEHLAVLHSTSLLAFLSSRLGWLLKEHRGIAATLQSATFNWAGMMVCRTFLAIAEAGYGPGIPYLLSFFYMRHEIGVRIGVFLSAAPLATCFSGALAYGITSGHSSLANWRLLFLVEGLPTIVLAFVALFFMPDSPDKARFLNESEREIGKARAIRQVGTEGASRVGSVSLSDVGAALLDVKNWLTAVSNSFDRFAPKLIHHVAHVLLLQRLVRLFTRFSSNNNSWNGV